MKLKFLALLPIIFIYSCRNSTKQQKITISISGAFALYPLVEKWTQEYSRLHKNINFNLQAGGAGKGLADVLSNAVDIGMFSQDITEEEKSKGIWWITLCKEAVLPTINSENPYRDSILKYGLTKEQFKSIFIDGRPLTWDSLFNVTSDTQHQINVYTREDASGAGESWASYLGSKQVNLKGTRVYGDSGIANAVKRDKNAIAYNNSVFVFDNYTGEKFANIEVVPLDINGNRKIDKEEDFYEDLVNFRVALYASKFPSPPERDLFFITSKRPTQKEILDFFHWVLSDGQRFVEPTGYVSLTRDILSEQGKKVALSVEYGY